MWEATAKSVAQRVTRAVDQQHVGINELPLVRLEVDVLLAIRGQRPLTLAERRRLTVLLGRECELRGLDEWASSEELPDR